MRLLKFYVVNWLFNCHDWLYWNCRILWSDKVNTQLLKWLI